jgi:hypothetical protein
VDSFILDVVVAKRVAIFDQFFSEEQALASDWMGCGESLLLFAR